MSNTDISQSKRTKEEDNNNLQLFIDKMNKEHISQAAISAFIYNYTKLINGDNGLLPESSISPVIDLPYFERDIKGRSGTVAGTVDVDVNATNAATSSNDNNNINNIKDALSKTVIIKLNGGLGTSMGLEKAKSLLVVKSDDTFLDLIAYQIKQIRKMYGIKVKFLLMNSFNTSEDTINYLKQSKHKDIFVKQEGDGNNGVDGNDGNNDDTNNSNSNNNNNSFDFDIEFLQNQSPKVDRNTLKPVEWESNPSLEWCPPGHGDIYAALMGSGMLDKLLNNGIKYAFVSNSDNLGAILDIDLLNYFIESKSPFMMECCERTENDKKGGHLAIKKEMNDVLNTLNNSNNGDGDNGNNNNDGNNNNTNNTNNNNNNNNTNNNKFTLRESAMCPDYDMNQFQDITKHKYFNTNNLWIDLEMVKKIMLLNNGAMPLPLIRNSKTVDPRNNNSTPVYQLETAMGAAIECFNNSSAIIVNRTRFAPVKTCDDLFILRSDAYIMTDDGQIVINQERNIGIDGSTHDNGTTNNDNGTTHDNSTHVDNNNNSITSAAPIVILDPKYYKMVDQMESLVPYLPSLIHCNRLEVKGCVKFNQSTTFIGNVKIITQSTTPIDLPSGIYKDQTIML